MNVTDSVNGTWSFAYDALYRVATATGAQDNNPFPNLCWSYDNFGNRTAQMSASVPFAGGQGGSSACSTTGSLGQNVWAQYNGTTNGTNNNQMSATTQNPNQGQTGGYDASGNIANDGLNSYLYDGEGRICAMASTPVAGYTTMTAYIYDAEGNRVAKGSISTWSCDNTINAATGLPNNGFTPTKAYVLGPHGEQLTEMTNNGNGWQLAHTNVEAGGLSATFDGDLTGQTAGKLYFHLSDWLGTRRQQTDYAGNPLLNFTGLPYGDGLSTIPVSSTDAADATEHHFTGKERDTESGNDYFEARYYSSAMGRFLSPDWSAKEEPVPYAKLDDPQSLNLYAYVQNNPLIRFDKDGHDFIILNDSKGAEGEGHNASLVGNDKQGWTYFSANGYGKGVSMDNFKTFSDFQKSDQSKRYDNADRITTTTKQDAAMKETGGKEINKPYSISAEKNADGTNKSQNCADLTAAIGKSGGVAIGTPQKTDSVQVTLPVVGTVGPSKTFTSPNQQYSGVVQNNNGTTVKAHCTGNNCSN